MRKWWKRLGLVAATLGTCAGFVSAQFPPGGGMMGPPPGGGMMGPPPGMMGGPPPGSGAMQGPPPGAFGGMPGAFGQGAMPTGGPAEFPNPAPPSQEPVSPFAVKDEGMPNAFSELNDPRRRINPPYCLTFRSEYLNWNITRGPINTALVTSSNSASDAIPGALGQPNTVVLVPASNTAVDYNQLNGFRWAAGLAVGYLPPLEVSGFSFGRNLSIFQGGTSDASLPYLARPVQFLDVTVGPGVPSENVEYVNIPTVANGNISITSRMYLTNVDVNFFLNFCDSDALKLDFIAGYRNTQFGEDLTITSTLGGNLGSVRFNNVSYPSGFSTTAIDSFRTANVFNGGQIGLRGVLSHERWSLFTDLKLGIGSMRNELTIAGHSNLNDLVLGSVAQTLPGGVLALPSNSGTASESKFTVIPEANFSLSYQVHPNFRIFGGYNLLYLSNVIRPGDHISSAVDSRQIPTDQNYNPSVSGIAPGFPALVHRDIFAHGFNVGFEFGF
jgi:Putative beta barrel porin-7 (BBP7)